MTLRASGTLNALPASGRAWASSASAAARKLPAVAGVPRSDASASVARQGLCATPPSASRTSWTTPSATWSAAATETSANAYDARSRTLRYRDLAANASGGRSTAVISSPCPSTVSRWGASPGSRCSPVSGILRSPSGPRMWTTVSSATIATAMSEGWVATHACEAPGHRRTDPQPPISQLLDPIRGQPSHVHQQIRGGHPQPHQVHQVGPAGKKRPAWRLGQHRHRLGHLARVLVAKRPHRLATSAIAGTTLA
jgi:hypothetical protein